jgi:hypothetical protein
MSKSVLEAIGPDIAIDGVPWLPGGKKKRIGINSLTANILCKRHNQTLSPLDDAAGKFFRKLQAIHVDLQHKSLSRKHSLVIMSGETAELWMLKLACGLFYSKNAAEDGARLIVDHHLNEKLVQEALFRSLWHDGCGLYMKAPQGPRTPDTDAISMEPLIAWSENQVVGSAVTFAGLEFQLIFDAIGVNKEQLSREGLVHRPSELRFRAEKRAHSVSLTWVPGTPPRLVEMTNTVVRKRSCSQKG